MSSQSPSVRISVISLGGLLEAQIPFLGAIRTSRPGAVILGAPLDVTETYRGGTREAPARVRIASEALETYSPILGRDLGELPLADWGDVPCPQGQVDTVLQAVADAVQEAVGFGLALLIGGEHTVTVGAVSGAHRRYPDLFVIDLDAHLDLRDSYEGRQLSHATVMRRVADEVGFDHLAQYGVRSGTREEFEVARRCLHSGADLALTDAVRQQIGGRPVYLTVDVDVLDPACAPGTGCPEPGGPLFPDLLSFLYSLEGMHVVALDVTEVLPAADVNDVTSMAAAKLIREAALLFRGLPS
jgi:agmatinase